jgi:hypothetical protein
MNIVDFVPNPKSLKLASQLLAEAKRNEPEITKVIKEITEVLKAELIGLESKFKTEESLAEKLNNYANTRSISLEKVAKQINDALRYTILFSPNNYCEKYDLALNLLIEKEYKIKRIWNAWTIKDKMTDSGYRGINVTIISSQKQKFELQFHTSESFRIKTETHGLYKERRNPKISQQRDAEILKILKKTVAKIERPKGT